MKSRVARVGMLTTNWSILQCSMNLPITANNKSEPSKKLIRRPTAKTLRRWVTISTARLSEEPKRPWT